MADRIELARATEFVALGPPADVVAVPKVFAVVLLSPGYDGSVPSRQARVRSQIVRRG